MGKLYAVEIFVASVLLVALVEGGYCPTHDVKGPRIRVTLSEKVEYLQQSIKSDYAHKKEVYSDYSFQDQFREHGIALSLDFKASGHAGIGGKNGIGVGGSMSTNAATAFNEVISATKANSRHRELEKTNFRTFQAGVLQIYQKVTKEVTIGSVSSKIVSYDLLSSVTHNNAKSVKELRQMAAEYLNYHYPDKIGTITGSTYTETACVSEYNCKDLPVSPNGHSHPRGCPGAVWTNGKPSKTYCGGKNVSGQQEFPWYNHCCVWARATQKCIRKHWTLFD